MNNKFFKTMFENLKDRFSKVARRVRQVLACLMVAATIVMIFLYPVSLWSAIVFALVAIFAFVFTLIWRDVWAHTIYSCLAFAGGWWIMSHGHNNFGGFFLLGSLVWCWLYCIMPAVLKKITPKLEHDTHANGISAVIFAVIFMVISFIAITHREDEKRERLFAKEVFMPVTRWEIEVQNGDTYYLLFTKRGYIEVSPQDYPEVRFVNKNTKVRYLPEPHSANRYCSGMLEIKNN